MLSIDLFAEDRAHELYVSSLLRRVMGQAGLAFTLNVRSAVGGHPRALAELKTYQRVMLKGIVGLVQPDLLIVLIDANCKGQIEARKAILEEIVPGVAGEVVVACPDPHIERWFFSDREVFARVIGVDQQLGQPKCERGKYKALLKDAVLRAGHFPTLGGVEFADELVHEMDLYRAARNEPSLRVLIEGLTAFAARPR
jgi:hypothetical protein